MRLSKVVVFLAFITVVQESTQNRCLLEKQNIESFSKGGDIIIGIITLIHSTIYQPYVTYCEKPQVATCESFAIRYYRDVLAVIFAIEEINQDMNLLPNLTLGFNIFDSCVSETRAIQATMMLVWDEPLYEPDHGWKEPFLAGIVGDSMSTLSIPIARLLGLCNYPQISFGAFDPALGDRREFPSFLRTVPNENIQNKAISLLLKHFGWTWVGILTRDDDLGELDGQNLKEEIRQNQGCVAFLEKIHYRYPTHRIRRIFDILVNSTAMAIVLYCEEMHLMPLLDMMSEQGARGKVWIYTLGFTYSPGMFSKATSELLNGSIGLVLHSEPMPQLGSYFQGLHPSRYTDDIFIGQFWELAFDCIWPLNVDNLTDAKRSLYCTGDEHLDDRMSLLFELEDLSYTFQAYIAVYAFAHALHDLLYCTNHTMSSGKCERESLVPWQVYQHLRNVHFKTQSGDEIYFNNIGEVPGMFDIMNLQIYPDNVYKLVKVGRYNSRAEPEEQIVLDISSVVWNQEYHEVPRSVCSESCSHGTRKVSIQGLPMCCFQCVPCSPGEISNETDAAVCVECPEDKWPSEYQDSCLPKMVEFLSYEEVMGISLAATSITFSVATLSILCIFWQYSETPVVKANNRSISYVILLGLLFCFLSSLVFIGYPLPYMCFLRQVFFGITFSVVVSGMLAKTITVILIFQSTKPTSIGNRFDYRISNVVMYVCPLFQVILCTVWLGTFPPYPQLNMTSKSAVVIAECNEGSHLFFYCMLAYMGFLAMISFIVAFLSRKLPDSFNEGQYITFSMFAFLSVWLCFIPAYLSAEGKNLVIVEVFAILASSAGLLGCLFFPKCYIILFRPEMNTKQYVKGQK